jgi:hypothetical protein
MQDGAVLADVSSAEVMRCEHPAVQAYVHATLPQDAAA